MYDFLILRKTFFFTVQLEGRSKHVDHKVATPRFSSSCVWKCHTSHHATPRTVVQNIVIEALRDGILVK